MLSMINRGRLDQATQEEFEHLIARLRGFLSQSFDEDGQLIVADPNLAIMPIGGLVLFATGVAPPGYLLCNGTPVSRVTYRSLFDVIGVTWGPGDGSTTFHLPDFREKVPIGVSAGLALATLVGEEAHALTTAELAPHTHDLDGTHGHRMLVGTSTGTSQQAIQIISAAGVEYDEVNDRGVPWTEPPLSGATRSNGAGVPHSNMQPSLAVNYLIFAGV